MASERHGIPVGWAIDGANRNDICLLEPTIDAVAQAGLLADIQTLHLDRGYDYPVVRHRLSAIELCDLNIQRRRPKQLGAKPPLQLGLRWIVQATNTWWSNYGQLRRSTNRRTHHRPPPSASPPTSSSSADSSTTAPNGTNMNTYPRKP